MELLVSSALEADSSLPSFFEMFMTQQVEQSLKPAARHAHGALAARWPTLHRMSPWFDEAYLALSVLVEARFLANNSCLLSESFYGLRRCRYGPRKGPPGPPSGHAEDAHVAFENNGAGYGPGQRLRARDRRKALLAACMLPYLLAKLQAGHERNLAAREHRHPPRQEEAVGAAAGAGRADVADGRDRLEASRLGAAARRARAAARRRLVALQSLFFQVYPLLHASFEGSCLVYQWLYLFRRSTFFSPALRLTGMVVRRATIEDWQEDAEAAAAVAAAAAATVSTTGVSGSIVIPSSSSRVAESVARYGRVLLVAAIVGFKIAEWWTRVEAQEGSSWRRAQLPPPPPPPQPPLPSPGGCGVPADSGACPVCGGVRVNPALCSASGFVFCFRCLSGHVREHGECPVTGFSCGDEGVVRLFDDEDAGGGGGT